MSQKTGIEWTSATWNPSTGCTKVSPGCQFCYAERLSKRLCAMGVPKYELGFQLKLHEKDLALPLKWRNPRTIFVNSMSDLCHESAPEDFIQRVFSMMVEASWHQFQVLTKRSRRLGEMAPRLPWPSNVWMGVSVENADYLHRIDDLRQTPAAVKFLSLEPLLGPLPNLNLAGIDWVIVGGESGPRSRPMRKEWVTTIRDECVRHGKLFYFKQWGGVNKKKAGRILDGQIWDEMPRMVAAPKLTTKGGE